MAQKGKVGLILNKKKGISTHSLCQQLITENLIIIRALKSSELVYMLRTLLSLGCKTIQFGFIGD